MVVILSSNFPMLDLILESTINVLFLYFFYIILKYNFHYKNIFFGNIFGFLFCLISLLTYFFIVINLAVTAYLLFTFCILIGHRAAAADIIIKLFLDKTYIVTLVFIFTIFTLLFPVILIPVTMTYLVHAGTLEFDILKYWFLFSLRCFCFYLNIHAFILFNQIFKILSIGRGSSLPSSVSLMFSTVYFVCI